MIGPGVVVFLLRIALLIVLNLCVCLYRFVLFFVLPLTNILIKKRELVAILLFSSYCIAPTSVPWLFLAMPLVGQLCVIVIFLGHTHLIYKDNRPQGCD